MSNAKTEDAAAQLLGCLIACFVIGLGAALVVLPVVLVIKVFL